MFSAAMVNRSAHLPALGLVIGFALLSVLMALCLGAVTIPFQQVLETFVNQAVTDKPLAFYERIVWDLRLPRTLLAFLAGAGLAIAGLILQTVTRNPLADPYLFGISSGASLGVVITIALIGSSAGGAISIAAFAGSLGAMFLLIAITSRHANYQVEIMLLAGVALSFLFSALTSLLLYWTEPQAVTAILFWTLGSFSRADWSGLVFPTLVVVACLVFMVASRRQLNALLLGDESAITLGINVKQFRIVMLVLSSLITATLVSICGGIGFVGLMIPHIVRFFISQGSAQGMLMTALVGGVFMVWVDVLSRTLLNNQELPVGIITAATGSIFFLALLYRKRAE
ncbi:FecCD family ABC transporter permease [Flocculibacter collagenilyticus]|uniref:FecCD family ABC transporter permease n=1 Tax=Flocculibacter collagenilyticus TaxID=2744479 RepID=UPI001F2607C0|nr:iron ABC transporter permease [Flocculibacter collagenilyticus]